MWVLYAECRSRRGGVRAVGCSEEVCVCESRLSTSRSIIVSYSLDRPHATVFSTGRHTPHDGTNDPDCWSRLCRDSAELSTVILPHPFPICAGFRVCSPRVYRWTWYTISFMEVIFMQRPRIHFMISTHVAPQWLSARCSCADHQGR
jgi:hypothetical protein